MGTERGIIYDLHLLPPNDAPPPLGRRRFGRGDAHSALSWGDGGSG